METSTPIPALPNASRALRHTVPPLLVGHALGLLVPLLTIPYLARTLRPDGWAPVLVAQALVAWVALLLEYGADVTGTRAVALHRASTTPTAGEQSRRVWGVQGAKILLLPVILVVVPGVMLTLDTFRAAPALAVWTLIAALARGFSPLWYFLGMERVRSALAVDVGARLLSAVAVFPLVQHPGDGWKVLAASAVTSVMATALLSWRLWREVPRPDAPWSAARHALRSGGTVFASRLLGTVFSHAALVLLSALASPAAVALYGGAERLIRAALNLLEPVSRAVLPRMTVLGRQDTNAATALFRRLALAIVGGAALLGIGVAWASPTVVQWALGGGYEAAIPILRVLSLLLPVISAGTVLGFFWALPAGRDQLFLHATSLGGVVTVVLALTLVPRSGALGMACAVVAAESAVVAVLVLGFVRRHHVAK